MELALSLEISPSFPIPDVLATRVETSESFGIIPVPMSLASLYEMKPSDRSAVVGTPTYRGYPVYLLSHLVTRPISPYSYLKERQKMLHAVLPIHTRAEFLLFTELMESNKFFTQSGSKRANGLGQIVNFEAMARHWNGLVHTCPEASAIQDQIFYKLPEQLERHYKTWSHYRAEKATMTSNSASFKALSAILKDTARISDLPDARPLPNPPTGKPAHNSFMLSNRYS